MSLSLLIVTPQRSFGEYIIHSVNEKHAANAEIVNSRQAALLVLEEKEITHAFLDMDLDGSILNLGLALRQVAPALPLILISPERSIPRFDALQPWTYLRKPFFLPDLLRVIGQEEKPALSIARFEKADEIAMEIPAVQKQEPLYWLKDAKTKALPHLTRLTLASSAQATLIIQDGKLWSYAGELVEEAANELVDLVVRDKKSGDLLKFLHLKTTEAEHMLFATALAQNVTLAIIFDAETPFSAIRNQASDLVESLIDLEPKTAPMPSISVEEMPVKQSPAHDLSSEDEALLDLFDFGDDEDAPPISEILDNIPNPNPKSALANAKTMTPASTPSPEPPGSLEASVSGVHQEPMPNPFAKPRISMPASARELPFGRESSPAIRASDFFGKDNPSLDLGETRVQEAKPAPALEVTREQHAHQKIEIDLNATRVSKSTPRPETPIRKPDPEEIAATRPQSITEVAGRVIIEPSSSEMYELTYACLLVPRFSAHHLTGDLAARLSDWMPNICVAFGWRLEYLAVRPDYLQWVVNVPPTTSPGYLMRIMRKQTSERIFEDFPRHQKDNPSGDFWAPGYLIMGGSQPHPSKLVRDYIERTRKRQGMT